jgi:hypothetical protein
LQQFEIPIARWTGSDIEDSSINICAMWYHINIPKCLIWQNHLAEVIKFEIKSATECNQEQVDRCDSILIFYSVLVNLVDGLHRYGYEKRNFRTNQCDIFNPTAPEAIALTEFRKTLDPELVLNISFGEMLDITIKHSRTP